MSGNELLFLSLGLFAIAGISISYNEYLEKKLETKKNELEAHTKLRLSEEETKRQELLLEIAKIKERM